MTSKKNAAAEPTLPYPEEDLSRDDSFHREYLARILCDYALQKAPAIPSPVIGIDGRWGSGKTWVAEKALGLLRPQGYVCVKVSAWQGHAFESLAVEMFTGINAAIRRSLVEDSRGVKRACRMAAQSKSAKQLESILKGLTRKAVSTAVLAKSGVSYEFDELFQADEKEESLSAISRILRKKEIKLVLLIDDLDRCTASEARQCLSFIRDLRQLGACLIICCFERALLEKQILEIAGAPAFVEKIIPVVLPLEPLELEARQRFLADELSRRMPEALRPDPDADFIDGWLAAVRIVAGVAENPRDLIRLACRFATHFIAVGGDDNVYRPYLLIIDAIHELYPRVWRSLHARQQVFFETSFPFAEPNNSSELDAHVAKVTDDNLDDDVAIASAGRLLRPLCYTLLPSIPMSQNGLRTHPKNADHRPYYFQMRARITDIPRDVFLAFRADLLKSPPATRQEIVRCKFGEWVASGKTASLIERVSRDLHAYGDAKSIALPVVLGLLSECGREVFSRESDDVLSPRALQEPVRGLLNGLGGATEWTYYWNEILGAINAPDGCLLLLDILYDRYVEFRERAKPSSGELSAAQSLLGAARVRAEQLVKLEFDAPSLSASGRKVERWVAYLSIDFGLEILAETSPDAHDEWVPLSIMRGLEHPRPLSSLDEAMGKLTNTHLDKLKECQEHWKHTLIEEKIDELISRLPADTETPSELDVG
ncbi:MAG: hypothetical protein H6818_07565 [Phycisphaerales bacterium]|nr:hypothetical protein [Phycisphaerales bacterium]MCB9864182.1 hypothetical protein [Phycisphaerales bacterium]